MHALIASGEDFVIIDVRDSRILDKHGWTTMPSATLIPLERARSSTPLISPRTSWS